MNEELQKALAAHQQSAKQHRQGIQNIEDTIHAIEHKIATLVDEITVLEADIERYKSVDQDGTVSYLGQEVGVIRRAIAEKQSEIQKNEAMFQEKMTERENLQQTLSNEEIQIAEIQQKLGLP